MLTGLAREHFRARAYDKYVAAHSPKQAPVQGTKVLEAQTIDLIEEPPSLKAGLSLRLDSIRRLVLAGTSIVRCYEYAVVN